MFKRASCPRSQGSRLSHRISRGDSTRSTHAGPARSPRPQAPSLGPRASRPQWAEGPPVFKRARCPRSQERHRLSHRISRGDSTRSTHTGPARSPGPRAPSLGPRASRPQWAEGPQVFKRASCPHSQERHRLSHRLSRGDSTRSTHAGPARSPEPRAPSLGARASRPQWAEGPQVFKRASCPRSQERHRLSHRLSRGDSTRSTHAGPARSPGPRAPSLGPRASRPQVGQRPTGVQAGKMPAIPGKAPPVSSSLPRRLDALDPRRPRSVPRTAGAFPGTAGVPPASGPKAHRCVQAGKTPALRRRVRDFARPA